MRFVAIDFETANVRADSACQLAAVVVNDGSIVAEHSWLIRPPRLYFAPRNIAIHGIRPKDVQDAMTMEGIWSELHPIIDGEVIMAHNARFDMGVLISSLAAFDVACPDLEFNCTRSLARGAWPGRPKYGLKPLGEWLGVNFRHHDALEDARCCAKIALAAAKSCQEIDLASLETSLRIRRGSYRQGTLTSPRSLGRKRTGSDFSGRTTTDRWGFPLKHAVANSGVKPHVVVSASGGQLPFAGRKFVFLGPLRGLNMDETRQLAEQLGGSCQTAIAADTDYVVACGTTLEDAGQLVCSSVARNAVATSTSTNMPTNSTSAEHTASVTPTAARGIRLLSERQFVALLPGGKAQFK